MSPPELRYGAIGAALGVTATLVVCLLVWPRDDGDAGAGVPRPAVTVRSAPQTVPAETPTAGPPSSSLSDQQSDDADGGGHGWKPSPAPPLADAAPAGEGPLPQAQPVRCPAGAATVSTADELQAALSAAQPGQVIRLADGTYTGEFVTSADGTAQQPIYLCGSRDAVLDGGDIEGGYVLHLDRASYWRLVGFTVTNGEKGVMTDGTVGSVIQQLDVHHIGDEAIHLRDNSTDNVVLDNEVSDTGLRRDKYGEGVYVGTAISNWCRYSDCQPDRSDRNVIKGNTIVRVTSEAVDLKEGTTGGVLEDNTFDGSRMSGADSWVDVKGNNWLIRDNRGESSLEDGFQSHEILHGWGDHNVFSGNTANVDGPGYGIALRPEEGNVVTCDNTAHGAEQGLSNISCTQDQQSTQHSTRATGPVSRAHHTTRGQRT